MAKYFVFIDNFSIILPVITIIGIIIGFFYFKKINSAKRILLYLLIASLGTEILSYISARLFGSNLIFLNMYAIIELTLIYSFLRTNTFSLRKFFDIGYLILMMFNIYELMNIDYQNFDMFQAYSRSLNSIFLLIAAIVIIIDKLNKDAFDPSNKIYYALPFFLVVNALLYLPMNILINFKDIRVYIVWLANTLNISIFFSIIIYQIWKLGRVQKM